MSEPTIVSGSEQYLDPDCRDGKHTTCYGSPCSCICHRVRPYDAAANVVQDDGNVAEDANSGGPNSSEPGFGVNSSTERDDSEPEGVA
jgi:hypothetical protein